MIGVQVVMARRDDRPPRWASRGRPSSACVLARPAGTPSRKTVPSSPTSMRVPGAPRTVLRYGASEPTASGGSNSTRSPTAGVPAEQREGGIAPGFVGPARVDVHARGRGEPEDRQRGHGTARPISAAAQAARCRIPDAARSPLDLPAAARLPTGRPSREDRRQRRPPPAGVSVGRPGGDRARRQQDDSPWRSADTRSSAASSATPQARTSAAVRFSAAARAAYAGGQSRASRTPAMRGAGSGAA